MLSTATRPDLPAATAVTACPACGAADAPHVGGPATGFDTVVEGQTFTQPPYAVCGCRVCGLYFKSMTLAPAALDSYYRLLDSSTFESGGWFPTDLVIRRRLAALPDGSRVLDVGCSTGRTLEGLTTRLQCLGVEPNPAAASAARARGIEVVAADSIGGVPRFDAILLMDVYEHLSQPVPLIEHLARALQPGGWLGLVTGNADAVRTRDRLAEFWYFRLPGHVIMAGEQHLRWLASRTGLELAAAYRRCHYDVPPHEQLRQAVQGFAYDQFRRGGWAAPLLRLMPGLRGAARWPSAPTYTCGADHVVAFFNRPHTPSGIEHA